jgi:hypothetical protein
VLIAKQLAEVCKDGSAVIFRVKQPTVLGLLDHEDDGNTIPQNTDNDLTFDAV